MKALRVAAIITIFALLVLAGPALIDGWQSSLGQVAP